MAEGVGKGKKVLVAACLVGVVALGLWFTQGRRGGGDLAGGCCGGGAWGAPLARGEGRGYAADAEQAALAYARRELGEADGLTAKVIDYGCHIGVDVYRDGKVVLRLAYRGNGRVEEI